MQVFISWSGKYSGSFAKILNNWLQCVIPNIQTFLSSKNIDPGTKWSEEISEKLQSCSAGIICLSSDNITSSWINFEAGALSKHIEKSNVIPILINITNEDIINHPLSQFQTISTSKEDIERLVIKLFQIIGNNNLKASRIFEKWWSDLYDQIKNLEYPIDNEKEDIKYNTILQNFNKIDQDLKMLNQIRDILSDLTSSKNLDLPADNISIYSSLVGLWRNNETDIKIYGLIIDGLLHFPYLYNDEDEKSLAHYHSIKIIGNRIYGRFKWFYEDIKGFFYLDIIETDYLEGEWFFAHEVSSENFEDMEVSQYGKLLKFRKVNTSFKPIWVDIYIGNELYKDSQ